MNIKINTMERGDMFLNTTVAELYKMNEFMETTFEFDAKIVHRMISGC